MLVHTDALFMCWESLKGKEGRQINSSSIERINKVSFDTQVSGVTSLTQGDEGDHSAIRHLLVDRILN